MTQCEGAFPPLHGCPHRSNATTGSSFFGEDPLSLQNWLFKVPGISPFSQPASISPPTLLCLLLRVGLSELPTGARVMEQGCACTGVQPGWDGNEPVNLTDTAGWWKTQEGKGSGGQVRFFW